MRAALVLIDLQRDYLDRPGLVPAEGELLARVAALLEGCRRAGVPVFHAMTLVRLDGANRMPHWQAAGTWACVEGTAGARPPQSVAPLPDEPVFAKDFYSALAAPGIEAGLAARGIDTLVLAGIYTHACIRETAVDAYSRGLRVIIATDAIGSTDAEHARHSLGWLQGRGARGLSTGEILAEVSGSAEGGPPREPWRHHDPTRWSEVLWEARPASRREVAEAVERARGAAGRGSAPPVERVRRLGRWLDELAAAREALVAMLVRDVAKPVGEARSEFDYAVALLRQSVAALAPEEALPAGTRVRVRHRPVGVVAIVTPWNNPLAIAVGKLAPALGYGNAVVWKPALPGTKIAQAVLETLRAAGLEETVALLPGDGETGRWLTRQAGIDAVSFTGSLASGRQVRAACADTGKPLQAELGGNNAVIVLADADIHAVATEVAGAAFSFSGQRCTAPRRIIVERCILPAFEAALVRATQGLRIGDPADASTRIGPLISRESQARLSSLLATSSGGRVACGGTVPEGFAHGCWFEPTIVIEPDPSSALVREEAFGPVVTLLPAGGTDEALALCNGVDQGLVASLFTNDARAKERFLEVAQAGMLSINRARPAFDAAAPFSGWKRSGHGPPEHGRWDREFYARPQAVYD